MKIAFEVDVEGYPVVLLHAFPQIEAIIPEIFRLILPDLREFSKNR